VPIANVIGLFFDLATEEKIKGVWQDVSLKSGVPNTLALIEGSRPHISLGIFGEGRMDSLFVEMASLAAAQAPFMVDFESLGIFDGTRGILFFGPTANRALLDLHEKCHDRLGGFAKDWNEHYLPGKLVFHCSINIGLAKDDLLRAAGAVLDTHLPMFARVEGLGLLQLPDGKANRSFALSG
jgi:2'-5' RNA ligase